VGSDKAMGYWQERFWGEKQTSEGVTEREAMATAKANTGILRIALRAQAQDDGEEQIT
jgi:hypothetical protein